MDYASLVHRVRELVWQHVPAGSIVAVVSKGDPELLVFDQRTGWHYPQTGAGQYLGHHPDTGASAVAYLESMRLRGAQYLVVPSIYAWFLDYYTDLRAHLSREGELIHRDENCAIYGLVKRELTSATTKTAAERQLRDLVAGVLPHGSTIVAFGWSQAALADTGDFRLLASPAGDASGETAFSSLKAMIQGSGAEYLVVPAPPPGRRQRETLADRCRATWTTVLDQRHVCAVFAIPSTVEAHR
ncbi:MAG TPA: hypothetical protein VHW94_10750 [Candidatus Dormibacteraeota bacterium]|jgi:hypothetical protein|nr:hypothetical protein [Candidatus Dormibacteraeota bacterium]